MKGINITITGDLGSGKSTIAKNLSNIYNYKYFSTGKIQRQLAQKKGLDTLELNYLSEKDKSIDKYIDDQVKKINGQTELYVLDSRLAWFFIKQSFKIYLTVNPIVAAQRVIADTQRSNEPIANTIFDKAHNLIERRSVEDKRFYIEYGVDCSNMANYDIVVDTTKSTIKEISNLIDQYYKEYLRTRTINKYWVSPEILYPTEDLKKLGHEIAKEVTRSVNAIGLDNTNIVQVVKYKNNLFIWDGHKRTSAAILNKISLIPIEILAIDSEDIHPSHKVSDFVSAAVSLRKIHDWEDFHNFRFHDYPRIVNE